ncbi:MAG TPA: hypothetical protein VJT09_16765 [Pyrinomonadaceae bacterium]|nr:hypothetical protein [Pyrinomonadaceae bacterium]
MKRRWSVLLLAGLCSLAFVISALPSAARQEPCDLRNWMESSLVEIETIKVGMTRRELMKVFRAQGGIFTRTQQQFVYRGSSHIHVTVKFEEVGQPGIIAPEQGDIGDDKIVEISTPFIAREMID